MSSCCLAVVACRWPVVGQSSGRAASSWSRKSRPSAAVVIICRLRLFDDFRRCYTILTVFVVGWRSMTSRKYRYRSFLASRAGNDVINVIRCSPKDSIMCMCVDIGIILSVAHHYFLPIRVTPSTSSASHSADAVCLMFARLRDVHELRRSFISIYSPEEPAFKIPKNCTRSLAGGEKSVRPWTQPRRRRRRRPPSGTTPASQPAANRGSTLTLKRRRESGLLLELAPSLRSFRSIHLRQEQHSGCTGESKQARFLWGSSSSSSS